MPQLVTVMLKPPNGIQVPHSVELLPCILRHARTWKQQARGLVAFSWKKSSVFATWPTRSVAFLACKLLSSPLALSCRALPKMLRSASRPHRGVSHPAVSQRAPRLAPQLARGPPRRNLFVQTEETPNTNALKFYPGKARLLLLAELRTDANHLSPC